MAYACFFFGAALGAVFACLWRSEQCMMGTIIANETYSKASSSSSLSSTTLRPSVAGQQRPSLDELVNCTASFGLGRFFALDWGRLWGCSTTFWCKERSYIRHLKGECASQNASNDSGSMRKHTIALRHHEAVLPDAKTRR